MYANFKTTRNDLPWSEWQLDEDRFSTQQIISAVESYSVQQQDPKILLFADGLPRDPRLVSIVGLTPKAFKGHDCIHDCWRGLGHRSRIWLFVHCFNRG